MDIDMLERSPFVPQVTFEQIPIAQLVSDQTYQRSLSRYHVAQTALEFDLFQINPVKVSRRDGVNYVFNGQHTIETVALVSGSRQTPVWCMVYDALNYTHEADIFANRMKHVRPLKSLEIFNAHVEAGNHKQLIIQKVLESYGLSLGPRPGYGVICAVSTVEDIYDGFGYGVLERTLRLCVGTWEGEIHSLSSNMLRGVARLVITYGDGLKEEQFLEKLGVASVKQISRTARERRPGALGFAEALLLSYNSKARQTLPMSALYKKPQNHE